MPSINYQLITPPSSVDISESVKSEVSQVEKVDLKNYIRNTSILITSLWKDPVNLEKNSIATNIAKPHEFQGFLKEILRRSRCSLNVLQIALFYLFKLQKKIKNRIADSSTHLNCPKKVFLISLILAFKYCFDSNYKFATWSKMSGLSIKELQSYEIKLLIDLNYELNSINKPGVFTAWVQFLSNQQVTEQITSRKKIDESVYSTKKIRVN